MHSNFNVPSAAFSGPTSGSLFTRILGDLLPKWPWFLLAGIVTVGLAFGYLEFVKPVYEVKASLLIVNDKDTNPEARALKEIELSNAPKNVEIEMQVIKSRPLLYKVVDELKLDTRYVVTNGYLNTRELYKSAPVVYRPVGKILGLSHSLTIRIINKENFELVDQESPKIVPFGEPFQTSNGTWKIEAADNINQYIGALINITFRKPEDVVNDYVSWLETRLTDKQSPIIELTIADQIPERGIDFLNSLIGEYNLQSATKKNNLTENTLAFIDSRLFSLSRELHSVETDIEGYKSARGLTDITSESKISLQDAQTNDALLNEINVQLKVVSNIEKYIYKPGNSNVPSAIGIEDPVLVDLIQQLSKLQLEKNKLLATTPESSHVFQPVNNQIHTTITAIKQSIRGIKASLLSMKSGLLSVNSIVESKIESLPGQEREYNSIKRQQSIKENLYTYLLQKREEVALSYASTLNDATIINRPYVETTIWPKKPFIFGLALILAFGLTAGFFFFKETFGTKIRHIRDVEYALSSPVVSELSYLNTKNQIAVLERPNTELAEQFRSLRTNLHYLHGNRQKGRVTLVTSSKSGEGKSFVSINLGIALALSGRKTVILDLDLHKPKLSRVFKLRDDHPGTSDYLLGLKGLNDIVQSLSHVSNLDLISSGSRFEEQNPSELIESYMLDKLVDELKMQYEDIIIDSPPLHIVNDALILSRLNNISLYVIRNKMTEKSELPFINKLTAGEKLPNLNIIFNCVRKSSDKVIY